MTGPELLTHICFAGCIAITAEQMHYGCRCITFTGRYTARLLTCCWPWLPEHHVEMLARTARGVS
jgi:hypothetical protein